MPDVRLFQRFFKWLNIIYARCRTSTIVKVNFKQKKLCTKNKCASLAVQK